MITSGSQTSEIPQKWNKNSLTTSQGPSEELSLKLLCHLIFLLLIGQTNILGSFLIEWLPLAAKHFKLYKIERKTV